MHITDLSSICNKIFQKACIKTLISILHARTLSTLKKYCSIWKRSTPFCSSKACMLNTLDILETSSKCHNNQFKFLINVVNSSLTQQVQNDGEAS